MKTLPVVIKKPLHGTFCYINASVIENAIKHGFMLEITIPQGRAIVDPRKWKETGKLMRKVFKRPNDPMKLWGNYVPLKLDTPKEEPKQQDTLF